jgi:transcriptional regulator with PAS, ATPase and Fis domain
MTRQKYGTGRLRDRMTVVESDLISTAFDLHDRNHYQTAEYLGISRRTLLYKLRAIKAAKQPQPQPTQDTTHND